jgi:hypothetical protein
MDIRRCVSLWAVVMMAGAGMTIALDAQSPAPASGPTLSCADIETFLKTAKIGKQREIPVGVTVPRRATLDNGSWQHDAAIQTTDVTQTSYQTNRGTELNFRDTWKFNVAGYELAKMLELNMVPPYVERSVAGVPASLSWWVSDAMMERDRVQKKITPPDIARWNDEMHAGRIFHELIGDTDFNMTNTLITKDWRVWLIDFSRAFRRFTSLQYPKEVTKVDRKLLANLRRLTRESLQARLGTWLTRPEINAVLARRDALVTILDKEIAARGEAAVLYDLPRANETCGVGLQ